jgi:peptidoglycan hydrolase CwlO-like protein
MNLTPEQIEMIIETAKKASGGAEQANLILGIIVAIGTILGFLVAVVVFIAKIGALAQKIQAQIDDNQKNINAAHDKIRDIKPEIEDHDKKIALQDQRLGRVERDVERLLPT